MKYSAICLCISAAIHTQAHAQLKKTSADEHIEVLGHKITAPNHDVAASVSALSSDDIKRGQSADLTQILKALPGVDISGSVTPLSAQPSIRGLYGERIHVSVDSIKRKTDSDGSQNISTIGSLGVDPSQLKQIQVLRGADSLTVGSGAIGGSIRMVTKDAEDYLDNTGIGAQFSVQNESVSDSMNRSINVFQLTDTTDTIMTMSHVEYDDIDVVGAQNHKEVVAQTDKIINQSERSNVALKNTWYFHSQHYLKSKIDYSKTKSVDQPYDQRLSLGIKYPTLMEDYKNDYLEGMVNYSYQPVSALIDLDIQAFYAKKTYDKITKGYIPRGDKKVSYDKQSYGQSKRHGVRLANLSQFDGFVSHKLAVELNYEHESFDQHQFEEQIRTSYYGESNADSLSISIIDQSQFFNRKLLVTAGLRYDEYQRRTNTFKPFGGNSDDATSSELGLTYKATRHVNFYLKTAQAFRAPSLQELYKKDQWRCHIGGKICFSEPQPNLKAEKSTNYEGGFGFSIENQRYADTFHIKAIYFNNTIDDYIDNIPFMYYLDNAGNKHFGSPGPKPTNGIPVATHRDYSAKNIGRLDSEGFEVESHYQYLNTSIYLAYSKMNMDVMGVPNFFLGNVDYTKQPYSEAPADKLTFNSHYQLSQSLNVGFQIRHYRSQQRLSEQYLQRGYGTSTATVYNFNGHYQGNGQLSGLNIRVSVDNITNKRYLRAPASSATDPSELGRNYKLALSYQF
ncbi:TonB-dependent receptor [Pseudoalteromonas sp. MMG013]|uniref:TonB-dependent receptor domain-containing protein n=1 Tax=Pseudoalteromonas sp. MMG013 TaxID=2822687 RepID=UPI001B391211|nr:TonB-dependent receptor [Pseudoalteromonas sp. MMG013]MBQ4864628.1 TonB-dependent receptor [Pseudoalteromonas sp. MMG013]